MSAGVDMATSVAARHRLRRVRRSRLRLALVRMARPRARLSIEHRTTVAGARPHLVVAPSFALSHTIVAGAPTPAAVPIAPAVAAPRGGVFEVHRLVERVVRLVERREAVLPAAPATIPGVPRPAPTRPVAALRRDLVLAKAPPTPPAVSPAAVSPLPARAPIAAQPAATGVLPGAPDLSRLTDDVLARIDRRFVAERERRGRV